MNLNNPPQIINNQALYSIESFDLLTYQDIIQIRQLPHYKVKTQRNSSHQAVKTTIEFDASHVSDFYESHDLPLPIDDKLFDYQQVITKVAYYKERYALFMDAGLGKCHGVNTPIIMHDGTVKMVQDIVEGDKLMGPDSMPCRVLSTNIGYGDLFQVNPVKGDPFVCNDVHVLSLRCTGTKKDNTSGQYVKDKLINIPLDEYLQKGKMFKSYYKLWRTGIGFFRKLTLFDPYLVGLYLGDGHEAAPAITTNDRNIEVIDYIEKWTKENDITIREAKSGESTSRFFTFSSIPARLQAICYDEERTKRIPRNYLINDHDNRLQLLAGLIDSDGYHIDNCYEIVSKYPKLAKDIVFLARSLGFGVTEREVTKGISSGPYAGFTDQYYKVTIYGDTDKIPVKVERKKALPRRQKKNVLNTGFDVEYIGKGDYYGFTLEGNGLYLLGDFTVTHNTFLLWELAKQIHEITTGKIILCVPLNILRQFEDMVTEFYPHFHEFIHLHKNKEMTLKEWSHYENVPRIGFINHEAFIKEQSNLGQIDAFLLDEASILKGGQGGNGKIARNIIKVAQGIRYRYAASATPAPNDRTEYAMIAWFLGRVNSEKEFFTQFFTLQGNDYVLKKNAIKPFYNELASWSIFIRNPAAYGFEDNLAGLKSWQEIHRSIELTQEQENIIHSWATKGKQQMLPGAPIKPRTMKERGKFSQVSKGFYYQPKGTSGREVIPVDSNKPQAVVDIVIKHRPEQVLIWTVFDAEGNILEAMLKSHEGLRVAHITGATKEDKRIELIEQFRHGKIDVMISKPRILGFGLNFQFCRIAIFSGLDDSYEKYYQAVKRIHRYGQTEQVLIYHPYTQYEYIILGNVLNKQKEAVLDFEFQERLYRESLYDELQQFLNMKDYKPMAIQAIEYVPIKTDHYELHHGDSLKIMTDIVDNNKSYGLLRKDSIDFSVFSPPFMGDLFVYSNDPADMGNTRGAGAEGGLDEFMLQFQFFLKGMYYVTKPGRLMAVHLEDIPLRKGLDGHIGLFDFVGRAIIEANSAGWILEAKIPILKNQQAQSIIKRISSLAMSNMETDRLRIAPCSNGYLVLFQKPGEADVKVSDLAQCQNCDWSGHARELNNWQPDRGYKSSWTLEPQVMTTIKDGQETSMNGHRDTPNLLWMTCPQCDSKEIIRFSEMNGNKWIMQAEGVWPENGMEDYDKYSKVAQNKRWQDWIWTSLGMWPDINETDVLRSQWTKDQENADKHLCPLPFTIARRAIEMYTLPGETVFTPFLGIGTEVVEAIKLGRKGIGIEIKPEYFIQAGKNVDNAVTDSQQISMYEMWEQS